MLVIFNLSFGQCSLIVYAPVNGPGAFVDVSSLDKAAKQPGCFCFIVIRHREVRIFPLSEDAEPLKVSGLPLQCSSGVFTTSPPDRDRRHVALFGSELAIAVKLDR